MDGKKNKEEEAKRNSSSAFKVGAISLAFLIIGYQIALFVGRSAVLRMEANRDKPDTVWLSSGETREEGGRQRGVSGKADSSSTTQASDAVNLRRSGAHSDRVQAVRRATRKVESFRFDPNDVSVEDLVRLGFSEKQAQSIDNYRQKGGRFRRKSDFAKSFVVSDSIYDRLERYIDIPRMDINEADSSDFENLPGIGPYFAAKMVRYRHELGGYSYPEQLMDIYNFDKDKYDGLRDLIYCSAPAPYALWSLPSSELRKHPYIRSYRAADAIVLYRENTPAPELSVEGLGAAGILSKEAADKLSRCLIAPL